MCGECLLHELLDNRSNYYKKSQKLSNAATLSEW